MDARRGLTSLTADRPLLDPVDEPPV